MNRDRYRRTAPLLSVETTGKNVEEAVQAALGRLRARRDEVEVEVIQESRGGFLGLGTREARVRVRRRDGAAQRDGRRVESGAAPGADRGRLGPRRAREELGRLENEMRSRRRVDSRDGLRRGPAELTEEPRHRGPIRSGRSEFSGRRAVGSGMSLMSGSERENGDRRDRREVRRRRGRRGGSRSGALGGERNGDRVPARLVEESVPRAELRGGGEPPAGQPDPRDVAGFTQGLLQRMGFQAIVEAQYVDDAYEVRIEAGEDDAVLIGRRGETLDALQHVLAKMASRGHEELLRVRVDVSQYRQKRSEDLMQRALQMAEQVRETGREVVTEPLPAVERRVIHRALANLPDVTTQALGNGIVKRVWIGKSGDQPNDALLEETAAPVPRSADSESVPSPSSTPDSAPPIAATEPAPISMIDPWDNGPSKSSSEAPAEPEWGRRPKPARGRRR